MIKFHNTLSGKIEPFHSLSPQEVKLYTCGPTVYDYAHIGNFRAYIFEDLLKRFLVFMGYKVTHVMNITDVDDKIIEGSRKEGKNLDQYTERYIDAFFADIKTLNIDQADFYPRATEHISEMVEIIKTLLKKGYAYEMNGSIYFNVSKFKKYGKLSRISLEQLKPGDRIDSDDYEKEAVHDFALWKKRKQGEFFWETEIGTGRPGWHIECSAMSAKYLGERFDIHCGGVDNIFPHHENEIAQSEAYSEKKFVNYWMHCQHLVIKGDKMSKSKGNILTLKELKEQQIDPMALRLMLLSTHYRKPLHFTLEVLDQTSSSLQRLKDFAYELKNRPFQKGENPKIRELINSMKNRFVAGLSNDLNISLALTAVFELVKKSNILISEEAVFENDAKNLLKTLYEVNTVLAVLPEEEDSSLPQLIKEKIELREKARKEKNFILADKIRDELSAQGVMLEDTKDGVRWKIMK